jgi:hypothetical protein
VFKHSTQNYTYEEKITFNGVNFNEGNHFNLTSSEFICPVNGAYFVSTTLQKNTQRLDVLLYVADSYQRYLTESQNDWAVVSKTIIVPCLQGQNIYLEGRGNYSVHGEPNIQITTFTVMLLAEYYLCKYISDNIIL